MTWPERLEAGLVSALTRSMGALSPAAASNLAGAVAGFIGPLLPVSQVAHANLRAAMPELDDAARRRVVRRSWSELGRTAGEFPHVAGLRENTLHGPGWQIAGAEHLEALKTNGGPAIFFTGHIGNWEVLPLAARTHGVPIASFYRAAQNPLVDALIIGHRRAAGGAGMRLFAKGAAGARQAMQHLRAGGYLGLLTDQKLNDGVEARLFGRPAMTAPAAAAFALHFDCPVIPVLCKRIGPARLRLVVEAPLPHPSGIPRAAAIAALTQAINDVLERWIRADPGSWLWMHRRWPPPSHPIS